MDEPRKKEGKIKTFYKKILNYYIDANNNIFHTARDAVFGLFALLVVPLGSLLFVFAVSGTTFRDYWQAFLSYAFPIIAISVAGIYDSYGRATEIENEGKKWNVKLKIRIGLDIAAGVLAAAFATISQMHWVPSALLIVSGGIVLYDALQCISARGISGPHYSNRVIPNGPDGKEE